MWWQCQFTHFRSCNCYNI